MAQGPRFVSSGLGTGKTDGCCWRRSRREAEDWRCYRGSLAMPRPDSRYWNCLPCHHRASCTWECVPTPARFPGFGRLPSSCRPRSRRWRRSSRLGASGLGGRPVGRIDGASALRKLRPPDRPPARKPGSFFLGPQLSLAGAEAGARVAAAAASPPAACGEPRLHPLAPATRVPARRDPPPGRVQVRSLAGPRLPRAAAGRPGQPRVSTRRPRLTGATPRPRTARTPVARRCRPRRERRE